MQSEYKEILVLGDSVTKGVILDEEHFRYKMLKDSCLNIVKDSVNSVVKSLAKFGQTLPGAIKRLEMELDNGAKPDVVVVELGCNDCDFNWNQIAEDPTADHKPNTPFDEFKESLSKFFSELGKRVIRPVVMTMHPIDAERYFAWLTGGDKEKAASILKWLGCTSRIYWWQERYNEAILEVADKHKIGIINTRGAFLSQEDYRPYLCRDGLHPNAEGHKLMAKRIMDFIAERADYMLKGNNLILQY